MSEINPKPPLELPLPESAGLETLAQTLAAAYRGEELPAPSAELRQKVEERLNELEIDSQGKVTTKENAMLKTSRYSRLREWILVGGGSALAGAALTMFCWPPARENVAQVVGKYVTDGALPWKESDEAGPQNNPVKTSGTTHDTPLLTAATEGETSGQSSSASSTYNVPVFSAPTDDYVPAVTSGPNADGEKNPNVGTHFQAITGGLPVGGPGMGAGGVAGTPPGVDGMVGGRGMPGIQGGIAGGPGGVGGGGGIPVGPGGRGSGGYAGMTPSFHQPSSGSGQRPIHLYAETAPGDAPQNRTIDPRSLAQSAGASATLETSKHRARFANGGLEGAQGSRESARFSLAKDSGGQPQEETERNDSFRMKLARAKDRNGDGIIDATEATVKLSEEDQRQLRGWYQADGKTAEQYNTIVENPFLTPTHSPLSTFSTDVDTASYSNVRRFLNEGQLPPPAAVRIEEMVNYFSYSSYAQPKAKEPFAVNMETAECPWQPGHLLLRVGLKGKEVHRQERPASNLVFLLDVSGSMADENKLPLLKTTMTMLVSELRENDRVTIVTYAGEAGLKLEPTSGDQKQKISDAISSLSAGGSTNGSAGIELAYQKASEAFIKEGTNRVILATDGDLNVGVTSDEALVKLIKEKAAGGTFLTVLGFGEGNLKDGKLEQIADNGNGMYAYIDSVREGRKVLVEQMTGSLVTIAKDVKIQIEFNPVQIQSYRLLGYENRVMAAADFNNDKKDAGEIGAGHTVTALYELVPVNTNEKSKEPRPEGEPLKYQKVGAVAQASPVAAAVELRGLTDAAASGELLTLRLRYKEPDGVESRLIEFPLKDKGGRFNSASQDFQFAAAVASFGMMLRGSEHRGSSSTSSVAEIAAGSIGNDPNGLRAEFVDLVRRAEKLGIK